MRNNMWLPWFAVITYMVSIYVGSNYVMKDVVVKKGFWRPYMKYWNLSLALFSTVASIKLAPHAIYILYTSTTKQAMCRDPRYTFGSGSSGFWCCLFMLSKFP